jgi:GNAT superfamily N-acetyltransferase
MKNIPTYEHFINEYKEFRSPLQDTLMKKYGNVIEKIRIIEDDRTNGLPGLEVNMLIIDPNKRGLGFGRSIMNDIIEYTDTNKKIAHLTPTNEFDSDLKKLTDFYKSLGFVKNSGSNKDYRFTDTMIRLPK